MKKFKDEEEAHIYMHQLMGLCLNLCWLISQSDNLGLVLQKIEKLVEHLYAGEFIHKEIAVHVADDGD